LPLELALLYTNTRHRNDSTRACFNRQLAPSEGWHSPAEPGIVASTWTGRWGGLPGHKIICLLHLY